MDRRTGEAPSVDAASGPFAPVFDALRSASVAGMHTLSILREAREILRSPDCWTKGRTRSIWGEPCHPAEEDAARFDLGGAIVRARINLGLSTFDGAAAQRELEAYIGGDMRRLNDDPKTDHTLIFETLDALIWALAERERKAAAAARSTHAATSGN